MTLTLVGIMRVPHHRREWSRSRCDQAIGPSSYAPRLARGSARRQPADERRADKARLRRRPRQVHQAKAGRAGLIDKREQAALDAMGAGRLARLEEARLPPSHLRG